VNEWMNFEGRQFKLKNVNVCPSKYYLEKKMGS
jgi:hypothetical protein